MSCKSTHDCGCDCVTILYYKSQHFSLQMHGDDLCRCWEQRHYAHWRFELLLDYTLATIIEFLLSPLCEFTSTPEAEALADLCKALLCNYEEALDPPSSDCKDSLAKGSDNTFTGPQTMRPPTSSSTRYCVSVCHCVEPPMILHLICT